MPRYKTETRPGLVALYDCNAFGVLYQPLSSTTRHQDKRRIFVNYWSTICCLGQMPCLSSNQQHQSTERITITMYIVNSKNIHVTPTSAVSLVFPIRPWSSISAGWDHIASAACPWSGPICWPALSPSAPACPSTMNTANNITQCYTLTHIYIHTHTHTQTQQQFLFNCPFSTCRGHQKIILFRWHATRTWSIWLAAKNRSDLHSRERRPRYTTGHWRQAGWLTEA